MSGHLWTDFITTLSDARAKRGMNIGRLRAKIKLHFLDGTRHNRRGRSAPAGVYGSHGAPPRIEQQNREAIGCPDANPAAPIVSRQGIAFVLAVR